MKSGLLLLFLVLVPRLVARDSAPPWLTDLATARTNAQETPRLILVNFTGSDWNEWCHRLRDEILAKPHFLDFARDNLVLVELDFPREKTLPPEQVKVNAEWAQKYSVTGFPTLLVLDATGRELARFGYMQGGPKSFVRELRRLAAKTAPAAAK